MRCLLSLSAFLLLASAVPAQAWLPALARPVPACDRPLLDRPQLDRFQLFWQRDRTPPAVPYGDLEIRDILQQWPGVLRRLDRLELGLRADPYAVPRDPYLPPRDYVPRDPYLPRGEICPRCPPVAPAPRDYALPPRDFVPPRDLVPREYLPPRDYLPRDVMPPAVGQAPQGYQRYQGAQAVRR